MGLAAGWMPHWPHDRPGWPAGGESIVVRLLGLVYDTKGKLRQHLAALDVYREPIAEAWSAQLSTAGATSVAQAVQHVVHHGPDTVMLCPEWHTPVGEARALIEAVREAGVASIAVVDFCDGTNTPFLGLLPEVDLFIKAHAMRDPLAYAQHYAGGHIFTDFLASEMGFDLGGWSLGSTLDPRHAHKLMPGWTWAASNRYRSLSRLSALVPVPWAARRIDINTRFNGALGGDDWYRAYRKLTYDQAQELAGSCRLTDNNRVGYKRYLAEMKFTKIALSPFGWGEVCYRDFEAIACGALLIKPDMSHLATRPGLYQPMQTYVPVKWDLSDLHETCQHYLNAPEEAQRIARNAQRQLQRFYREEQFVGLFGAYLQALVEAKATPAGGVLAGQAG